MKVAILFSAVFPYRVPVFDALGDDYTVIYQAGIDPNRTWDIGTLRHKHVFLKERYLRLGWERFLHCNLDTFSVLSKIDPDVVVLYGDTLTMQFAFLWARLHNKPTVYWTDGWAHTERNKSARQKWIEKEIVIHSLAYIATGIKTRDYLEGLGANKERIFISRIVRESKRQWDCIYVAQLIERKQPMFVVEVMKQLPGVSLLVIGDGPLREQFLAGLAGNGIKYKYYSKVPFAEIPKYFEQSKICLFPTLEDTWGIVANEAVEAGCQVIVAPEAGCAGDLVTYRNGYVIPLDISDWAMRVAQILFKRYTVADSANAIKQACAKALEWQRYQQTGELTEYGE